MQKKFFWRGAEG